MPIPAPELWTIRVHCRPILVETVEEAFEGDALALSTYDPPRAQSSAVEILVDGEPDREALLSRLSTTLPDQEILSLTAPPETLPSGTIGLEIFPVGNLDWLKKVAEDFPPLPIARWTVYGAAHKDKVTAAPLPLQIDATSAFGTGEHPTTRGCLLLLDQLLLTHPKAENWNMLDMGCGSGILAMAFSKASGGHALGVDMEEQSVEIARDNAHANGLSNVNRFEISMGYAHPAIAENAPYDLIMANIFADPLCEMAPDLRRHLKPGGFVILSGILTNQAQAVIAAHEATGLILDQNMILGEWSALALHAPPGAS